MNTPLVIDLNSIVTAALMVGKDPDGYEVDGVAIPTFDYGWKNWLMTFRKTIDTLDIRPKDVIGVFDAPKSRQPRQRIWDGYKAHREKRPDEFYEEFNKTMDTVQKFIKELGGTILFAKVREADDVIAHIAPKLPGAIVWSKDKDLLSILNTSMYINGDFYPATEESCGERFSGIPRRYIPLYRTLVGDPGDFKGMSAKGFGEKAFINMWMEFGDEGLDEVIRLLNEKCLDELEENVDEFKPLQKILDDKDTVYTTWKLAQSVKVEDHKLNWSTGMVCGKDCETFDIDFEEFYGVQTLVTKDNLDDDMLEMINQHIDECDFVSLDIETDVDQESLDWVHNIQKNIRKDAMFLDALESKLCGLSITVGDNMQHTYYFCVDHADTNNVSSDMVKDIIVPITKDIIVHNASGFELPVLYKNWGEWIPNVKDNVIAASYVDENAAVHLKGLSMSWLKYQQQTYKQVIGDKSGMREITGAEVQHYGCDDTICTEALYRQFRTIMQIEGTWEVFLEVESDSQYMCAHAFVNGMNCDLNRLEDLKAADQKTYDEQYKIIMAYLIKIQWEGAVFVPLEAFTPAEIKRAYRIVEGEPLKTNFRKLDKLAALCGTDEGELGSYILSGNLEELNKELAEIYEPQIDFKPNSPKMMSKLLYETMNLKVRYRNDLTPTQISNAQTEGNPSSDEAAIKWAISEDANEEEAAVLEAVMKCRATRTRAGLYFNPYKHLCHWKDGKLHPALKQSKTTSRRFAPTGPNVNQIPKRSDEGKKVRESIIPHRKDAVIVAPDFSGQELRLAAEDSQDENFLACYVGDDLKDLHSITGWEIYKKINNIKEGQDV